MKFSGIEVKQDSSDEVVCKSEAHRYSQRYRGRAEAKDLATINERNPLIEQCYNEVKHGAADLNETLDMVALVGNIAHLVTGLAPVYESIMEADTELRLLQGV